LTLTPNYNPNPLHPRIKITNKTGASAYNFVSHQLDPNGTQDFQLQALRLHLGVNDDFGSLTLVIHDHNNSLTDLTDIDRPSVISREWGIQLYLGKTLATEQRWFYGKIKDVVVERPSTGLQIVTITAVGWGIILRERLTRLIRNQAKTSDGVTLDDTDVSTRIDNLILDLFQDLDHQVDNHITQLSNITAQTSTTGNGICEQCTDIKIANVNFNLASYAQVISNLVGITNGTWQVDYDRRLIVQDPETIDSGFLFTNNLTGTDAQTWDYNKIGYVLNSPISWQDSSADTYYSFIHGFGHFSPKLVASLETTPDASDNLDTAWHAIPFTVPSDNIFKISIRAIKTGTLTTDGSVQIWGDTGGSGPDPGDIRRTILLNAATLNALGTTTPADWFEIPIKPKLEGLTPNEQLYIVFPTYGTATDTYNINYKTATGTFWDSADGVTWTSRTGASSYRAYDARRLISTVENVEVAANIAEPRERAFPIRSDLEEQTVRQTLLQAANLLGKQRRIYSPVIISPVTERIPLGTFCRIEDKKTGLDTKANIISIDLMATADEQGVQKIEVGLDQFHY
jgi:hypothetical protein